MRGGPAADNLAYQSRAGLSHVHLHPNTAVTCPNDSRQDKGEGTGREQISEAFKSRA